MRFGSEHTVIKPLRNDNDGLEAAVAPAELPIHWRRRAQEFREVFHLPEGFARQWELAAEALERSLSAWENELLSIDQAATESNKTVGHLRRLIRDERLANHGSESDPMLRRGDLSRKLGYLSDGEVVAAPVEPRVAQSVRYPASDELSSLGVARKVPMLAHWRLQIARAVVAEEANDE